MISHVQQCMGFYLPECKQEPGPVGVVSVGLCLLCKCRKNTHKWTEEEVNLIPSPPPPQVTSSCSIGLCWLSPRERAGLTLRHGLVSTSALGYLENPNFATLFSFTA